MEACGGASWEKAPLPPGDFQRVGFYALTFEANARPAALASGNVRAVVVGGNQLAWLTGAALFGKVIVGDGLPDAEGADQTYPGKFAVLGGGHGQLLAAGERVLWEDFVFTRRRACR